MVFGVFPCHFFLFFGLDLSGYLFLLYLLGRMTLRCLNVFSCTRI